jgi:hypothetical protein
MRWRPGTPLSHMRMPMKPRRVEKAYVSDSFTADFPRHRRPPSALGHMSSM